MLTDRLILYRIYIYATSMYSVLIKYCVFKISIYITDSIFLDVSVRTHARQVEHQRCSRTGRVQKFFLGKTQYLMNTLYIE